MANPEKTNIPPLPGMTSMADSLEFVRKLWGGMGLPGAQAGAGGIPGMNIPGMVMPTLSVEEINKKISDLKTVETWLAVNMNMLRGTIQALEVQAATLSALNAMGQTVGNTMKAAGAMADGARSGSGEQGKRAAPGKAESAAAKPGAAENLDAAAMTAPLVNAAAWWNMLQNQFQQAVGNAMQGERKEGVAGEDGASVSSENNSQASARKPKDSAPDRHASGDTPKAKPKASSARTSRSKPGQA